MAIIRRKAKKGALAIKVEDASMKASDVIKIVRDAGLSLAPLDVRCLAKSLNIRVTLTPLEDDISGYLNEDGGQWNIVVNALHHPRRQRFTIAHELGHYFLHRSLQDKFVDKKLFRDGSSTTIEAQANRFASEVLMPEVEFRDFVASTSGKVEDIAENFGVSSMAVNIRAEVLGMV